MLVRLLRKKKKGKRLDVRGYLIKYKKEGNIACQKERAIIGIEVAGKAELAK